ncbi:MAG: DUF2971 domain-containing protein, partial [Desulfovibrionaceae bacterium]|nr:DUF2971 domain-containing protein [Desulfovibrionaceae bacterium]
TNIPMWNHYANKYKGICIQYNMAVFEKNSPQRLRMFPVKYVKKLLEYADNILLSQNFIDIFTMIAIHKLEDWSYENEWRYIPLLDVLDGQSKLLFPAIDKIYMGHNIAKSHEYKLKEVSKNCNVELYKMTICANGIDFTKIT